MKIGIILNNQHTIGSDMTVSLREQLAMVRLAREGGWDSYLASMHYLNTGNAVAMQQVPLLGRLAGEAGQMTMGVAIYLLNLHNPVLTAEHIATLDIISGGNFVFGIGLGYRDEEFNAFGVPKGQRVARFETCLDLVKRLWSGEEVSYDSDWCRLDKARLTLLPVQRPHPPIWFGANHDNAVRRAALLGDCWYINPHATLDTNKRQMTLYLETRKQAGLPPPAEVPCRKEIFCARTRAEALEMAGPYLAEKYKLYTLWGQDKAMPDDERLDLPLEELAQNRFVIGSPEDCYEQLRPWWEQLGVTHFVFRTHFVGMPISHALHSMRMITRDLLPALREVRPPPPGGLPA